MSKFVIRLADFTFEIETRFPETEAMCRNYMIAEGEAYPPVDEVICITEENLRFERNVTIKEALQSGEYSVDQIPDYPDGFLETTAVYRKIADFLSRHKSCVFHGALIEKDGLGYLFTAKSGTGKTTHIGNWLKLYPQAVVVNGDKPILRIEGNAVRAFGTPWSGKEHQNVNKSVLLKAIILLERGEENHIEPISKGQAIGRLMKQCYRPHDDWGMKRALEMCSILADKAELYRLVCNMDIDSARVAYEGMKNHDV